MLDGFEEIPREAVAASRILSDFHTRLGKPKDPFSESGKKLMDIIISIWQDLYPMEFTEWSNQRKDYKLHEMKARDQVHKHTGRSLASYPYPIFQMMKKLFPDFDPTKRSNCLKMVKKWPMFQFANKA